jgi:hypothetical protein
MVWYGMVWDGMVWYGMVWYGMVRCWDEIHVDGEDGAGMGAEERDGGRGGRRAQRLPEGDGGRGRRHCELPVAAQPHRVPGPAAAAPSSSSSSSRHLVHCQLPLFVPLHCSAGGVLVWCGGGMQEEWLQAIVLVLAFIYFTRVASISPARCRGVANENNITIV